MTNDNFILSGYDENDIIQHYAGVIAFIKSAWSFPIGKAINMAYDAGTIITYTDSIPIYAILFKVLEPLLPDTFQYFGIVVLLNIILQILFACKILFLITRNSKISCFLSILFGISPILLERAFRHTALSSHWIILASIYLMMLYLKDRNPRYISFMMLELFAISIHPYFLPMVWAFIGIVFLYEILDKKFICIIKVILIQCPVFIWGFIIGALGHGINISRSGYGYYSMNINALINPISCGKYTWSRWFVPLPQILGNYDGFNYLGAGIIFLSIITFVFCIAQLKQFVVILKKYYIIILALVCLTCFAVTNVVTFNGKEVLNIPLLPFILKCCGIFRASSRLFYPVYYSIMIFSTYIISKLKYKKIMTFIFLMVVILQIYDISPCLLQKRMAMDNKSIYHSKYENQMLYDIMKNNKYIAIDNCKDNDLREITCIALKNDLKTLYTVANSGYYDDAIARNIINNAKTERNLNKTIIVSSKDETIMEYSKFDYKIYRAGDYSFIYEN